MHLARGSSLPISSVQNEAKDCKSATEIKFNCFWCQVQKRCRMKRCSEPVTCCDSCWPTFVSSERSTSGPTDGSRWWLKMRYRSICLFLPRCKGITRALWPRIPFRIIPFCSARAQMDERECEPPGPIDQNLWFSPVLAPISLLPNPQEQLFLQNLTELPEYSFLPAIYNNETRGLGAIRLAPTSSAAEENVLCYPDDDYLKEDIFIRCLKAHFLLLLERFQDVLQNGVFFATGLQKKQQKCVHAGRWPWESTN